MSNEDSHFADKNFAYCSFAFASVTGFCIGGTALANVIGIPYINKRLSLKDAVSIDKLWWQVDLILVKCRVT
jgi:hypothetical protein